MSGFACSTRPTRAAPPTRTCPAPSPPRPPGSLRDLKVDAAGNLYYLAGIGGILARISYQGATGGGQPASTPPPLDLFPPPAADVTALARIRRHPTVPGARRGRFRQTLTIVNVGGVPIQGPLSLALDRLGGGVRLLNAAGVTQFTAVQGSQFVTVLAGPGDMLVPGGAVSVTLVLRMGPGRPLAYRPRLLAGDGLR